MKITIIGPVYPYRGGIAHYTALLAQKMSQCGHEVQVISFQRQYPSWLYPGKTDRDPSMEHISTNAQYILDPLYPWTWIKAANETARFHPNLVLLMWWSTFWAPADWALSNLLRTRGFHVVYLIHNVLPHELHFYDRWLARLALNTTQDFIALTSKQAERLRSVVPGAHITQAVLPVQDMFEGKKLDQREARKTLHVPEEGPVLLFFGIVRPYKGLMFLLEAVGILKKRQKYVHLLIAGEFWDPEPEYRQKAEAAGIADQIHITNRYIENEEVPLYFSAADIFVAPYVGGTQSGTINLALSFGLPIIMTEPTVESVHLEARSACRIVAAGDSEALADAIAAQMAAQVSPVQQGTDPRRSWQVLISAIEQLQGK